MNDITRLAEIAERVHPCPIPDALNGYDCCSHGPWPCRLTEAAWLARGLDIDKERQRQIRHLINQATPDLPGDMEP